MPNLIDEMNYEYENPSVNLNVHKKLALKFLEKYRERFVDQEFHKENELDRDRILLQISLSKENRDGKLEEELSNEFTKIKEELETTKQNSK